MTEPAANEPGHVEDGYDDVIQPNKTEEERIDGLLKGDLDTEELPEQRKTSRPIVVGIGASAGGLEAMSTFFDALPPDTGLTFVVVTHLSPDHKSVLDELLQRHTAMPVRQVLEERLRIEPNHVYVVPPNRQLVLTDAHLQSEEFEGPRAGRAPIDVFFRSLAAMHSEPMAIIMSGGGSDGALGVRSIKEASGVVMVQDPQEAMHDSMPHAALATGVVDLVLPARDLARMLVELNRRRVRVPTDPAQLSPEQHNTLQRILTQLNARTGYDFRAYKQSTILRRIQRRMQITGYETLEGYLPFLRQNVEEGQALLGDLLIGVTNFFRDEASWRFVAENVVPQLFVSRGPEEVIRVWSIGCSTGEEAYTLAILLMEHAATLDNPPGIQVFATDLDDGSLSKAREGFYPDAIAADVSAERLQRFFTREGSYYRVRREVRDAVLFATHSVLRDPPFSRLDLLVCRNLLIYLQRPLQDNLFEIFHYALRPGGFLYLGNSESADSANDLFATVDKKHRIYRAREWTGQHPALPSLPLITRSQGPRLPALRGERRAPQGDQNTRAMYEHTLEEFGPPSILVDDEFTVIRVSGTAGRYLRYPDGPLTHNLTRLVREELQFELRSGLFQAFEKGLTTVSAPIPLNLDGQERRVFVSVWPRRVAGEQRLALVVFVEDQTAIGRAAGAAAGENGDQGALRQMEGEVRHLRERLQATVEEYETSNEELKAANEELQSINEEYRSTTEELETSKEELQSVNEELETVNNELKSKLEEISRAHSDLQNLLTATEIGTLFLDRDLRIQRYTVGVEGLFNIMRGDRGRPIAHLTHHMDYPDLVDDAAQVLRTLVPLEREVRHADGNWYLARLRPYRTIDDRIEGVVLTFVNISALKEAEQEARRSRDLLDLALGAARMGWGAWNVATGHVDIDARGRELFGLEPEQPLTVEAWLERIHPDDRQRVRQAMQTSHESGERMEVEYRLVLPNGRLRHIHGTGTFVSDGDRAAPRWTGLMRDVTQRHEDQAKLQAWAETLEARVHERTAALEAANAETAAARDRFLALFQVNPMPSVIIQTDDLVYVDANEAYLDFYGLDRDQVVGQSLLNSVEWPDEEAKQRALDNYRRGDQMDNVELELKLATGETRTVLASNAPIELDGRPYVMSTFTDITARKEAEEQVRQLASQLSLAEQAERQRISAILHDDLQQRLYALQVRLASAQALAARGETEAVAAETAGMSAAIAATLNVTRRLSLDLSPPILEGEGLHHALKWLATQMKEQYGLSTTVTPLTEWQRLEPGLRVALFQTVRELLFNVVKHAGVNEAQVSLAQQDHHLTLVVRDDGVGFDPAATDNGNGLLQARRRVSLFGGEMSIDSRPGAGTTVSLVIPLSEQMHAS